MPLLETIKERAYAANFNGGTLEMDSADVTELNQILASFAEMTDTLDSDVDELKDDIEETIKEIDTAGNLLLISFKIIQANEKKLPAHFVKTFSEALYAVQKQHTEIRKSANNANETAGKIYTEIYTNGLHG